MKLHAKLAIGITVIGLLAIGGWLVVEPMIARSLQADVSDGADKGMITIGMDGWVGYFPLCSPEMKRNLHREGYGLRCIDDAANYTERFKQLKDGNYQFAVATVDSYLLNAEQFNFPGPIVAVIDESKGGDAIIARKSVIASLEDLKNASAVKVTFTPDSPSHHLLKAVAVHFDVPLFRESSNFIEAEGSEAALTIIRDKRADVAVVWEPEVSKALEDKDYIRLLGTEDTQQLIVDILIASQRTVKSEPDMIRSLMKAYFKTLKYYRDNKDKLVKDISREYDIKTSIASSLLDGVAWATLSENAERWYGVESVSFSDEALVQSIISAADVLMDAGDFGRNPIPNEDPYRLINSSFIQDMYRRFAKSGGFVVPGGARKAEASTFTPLNASQWERLESVGSLKIRKITFASGTSTLTLEGKRQIDALMNDLQHYPNFRVEVRGHSGVRGDSEANLALSRDRAESVIRYIEIAHSIDENRIRAIGFGGTRPLKKRPGESSRSYQYRLPRVEIALVREVL